MGKTEYLGDGAYAQLRETDDIAVYADREGEFMPGGGIHQPMRHWVSLEPDALQKLVDFARGCGWKIK